MENGRVLMQRKQIFLLLKKNEVFTPNAADHQFDKTSDLKSYLDECHQLDLPLKIINRAEIVIKNLKDNKAPGYALITAKILTELPTKAIVFIMYIFNACLTRNYLPSQWKVAEVKMIRKPAKNVSFVESYRPTSLLMHFSETLVILFLKKLALVIEARNLIQIWF